MTDPLDLSRRRLLAAAGVLTAAPFAGGVASAAQASDRPLGLQLGSATTPPVAGLHLQFGADASSEITVSWHTLEPVREPRALVGDLNGQLVRTAPAQTRTYTDGKSKQVVYAHHAKVGGLSPDHAYLYAALHEDAAPEFGTVRTAPRGRARFTFTSFGDAHDRFCPSQQGRPWSAFGVGRPPRCCSSRKRPRELAAAPDDIKVAFGEEDAVNDPGTAAGGGAVM